MSDSGVISGNFNKWEAEEIASSLTSGSVPATFEIVEEKYFGK